VTPATTHDPKSYQKEPGILLLDVIPGKTVTREVPYFRGTGAGAGYRVARERNFRAIRLSGMKDPS